MIEERNATHEARSQVEKLIASQGSNLAAHERKFGDLQSVMNNRLSEMKGEVGAFKSSTSKEIQDTMADERGKTEQTRSKMEAKVEKAIDFKGIYIDTRRTDTNTCAPGTPRGDGSHVFVSVWLVSI